MNRYFTIIFLALLLTVSANAQKRISCEYNNVPLSEVLSQLAEQQSEYSIMFLYNELEDFRITASVNRKTVPDAIRQLIGLYPIRMIVDKKNPDGNKIFVECIHKTDRHLTGTIIDEESQPIAYANIVILNPTDSTLLCGGVSNESGYFVVPCEQESVLVRISYVGYKTIYKTCNQAEIGTIQLQPEIQALKGVTVKGHRRFCSPTDNGLQVSVQGTPLEQFGSVTEMLTHLPLMMSDGTMAGHGKPEIYINNKKIRDIRELDRLRADEILSVEMITSPGAEYGAEVTSVIRLKTTRKAGEGWSGNFSTAYRQGKEYYGTVNTALNYRLRNGMDFFARGYLTDQHVRFDATANDQLRATSIWDYQKDASWLYKMKYYFADFGWNWDINDHHSVGLTYTAFNYLGNSTACREMDEQTRQDEYLVDGGHSRTNTLSRPNMTHSVNTYYIGNIGKWNFDFSADYYDAKSVQDMDGGTEKAVSVSSKTIKKNQLVAEKLVVTAPVPKGELTFGEEASVVDRKHIFTQSGFSSDSHIQQHTSIWSLFANYSFQMGKLSFNAGVRWQNEHNNYDVDGQRNDEMSPDYSVLIPRFSASYHNGKWNHKLSYHCSRNNPSYGLLSSSVNYRSKYEYDTGNPFLKPQTLQNISWSSSYKWFYAEAFYQYFKNSIRSFQTAYDDVNHPGVVIMDYRNTPKQEYYGVTLNFTPKIGLWQLNYSADLYFCNDDVYPLGITHKWNGLITNFTLDNTFSFPRSWLLNVTGSFSPYYESGPCQTKATGFINLRLSKQFFKDKSLSVAILANDILHTQYTERTAYGGINIRTQYREYKDTQRIGIDLSWKFNTTRSRYKGSHAGQSERNRL